MKRILRLQKTAETRSERTIIALLLMAAIIALTLVFLRAQPSGIETFLP